MILVENIGKKYRLGASRKSGLQETISGLFRQKSAGQDFWALRNINFDINEGEVVGIIGKNGAGKSTLLKILSRITHPSEGRVIMNGRVSSLLEVGTGFHPELSGKENIFLNGTILGMSRNEIKRKFDEIVEFAEVNEFLHTAVKHYSSGMYVRLAFSVAAHLEPEVLIIDEVLAVGDASFQQKCLGKMEGVAKEGRTVLFVSHNMSAVEKLCNRGILLESGRLKMDSREVSSVVSTYLNSGSTSSGKTCWVRSSENEYKNSVHSFDKFSLHNQDGSILNGVVTSQQQIGVEIEGEIFEKDQSLNVGFGVYDVSGRMLFWSWARDVKSNQFKHLGHFHLKADIPAGFLGKGKYTIEIFSVLHHIKDLVKRGEGVTLQFEIEDGAPGSVISPKLQWKFMN